MIRLTARCSEEAGPHGRSFPFAVGATPWMWRSPCQRSNLATAEAASIISRASHSASWSVSAESRWTATILPLQANERSM